MSYILYTFAILWLVIFLVTVVVLRLPRWKPRLTDRKEDE